MLSFLDLGLPPLRLGMSGSSIASHCAQKCDGQNHGSASTSADEDELEVPACEKLLRADTGYSETENVSRMCTHA